MDPPPSSFDRAFSVLCRWNGNTMTLSSCNGTVIANGIGSTFYEGPSQIVGQLCLEVGLDGLSVEVGGGLYQLETSWSITFPSGYVESGSGAGPVRSGTCISPFPTLQPSVSSMPTSSPSITPIPTSLPSFTPTTPCEIYRVQLYDVFGDG